MRIVYKQWQNKKENNINNQKSNTAMNQVQKVMQILGFLFRFFFYMKAWHNYSVDRGLFSVIYRSDHTHRQLYGSFASFLNILGVLCNYLVPLCTSCNYCLDVCVCGKVFAFPAVSPKYGEQQNCRKKQEGKWKTEESKDDLNNQTQRNSTKKKC